MRCTEAFLDDIVANQERYIGLPLCADVNNLVQGQYEDLGHCYDPETNTFATSIIGSFYKFEKEAVDEGYALVGYARILKRNANVCKAIGELFASGNLKFSFEIACGSYETLEDGTFVIGKAKENYLEGMCVVSFPACPEATARLLVAEIMNCASNENTEAEKMPKDKVLAEQASAEEEPKTEEVIAAAEEPENETPDENEEAACKKEKKAEEEEKEETEKEEEVETAESAETKTAEEKVAEEQTAEKYVETTTVTHTETRTHDWETDETTEVEDTHIEREGHIEAEALKENFEKLLAEIAKLHEEIAELKKAEAESEPEVVVANANEVRPFVENIASPKKYSLLEKEETKSYSLLDRAE